MTDSFLSTITVKRETGLPNKMNEQIGKLYHNPTTGKTRLLLFGWMFGWAKADPHEQDKNIKAPYIHGDLMLMVDAWADKDGKPCTHQLRLGYILTKESEFGVFYGIKLEILPTIPSQSRGYWIEVVE